MTDAGSALDGVQEYLPESESRTWRSRREVDVTGFVLSVTMATPPRDESCLSSFLFHFFGFVFKEIRKEKRYEQNCTGLFLSSVMSV